MTVAIGLLGLVAAWAQDTPDCATVSGGEPILYGAGGSAQRDLIGKISGALRRADAPLHLVYKDDAGACSGIDALTGLGATAITGSAYYWDDAGTRLTCNLPLAGEPVDFGMMGNAPLACPLITDPSLLDGILDVTGPISTVNLIVSNASSQQSISSEAAYLVYGLGPTAGVAPWNNPDPSYYIRRNENSFVQIYVALATSLPPTRFFGVDAGTNANSVAYLAALADPEQGISFCSGDVADANRATARTLAYQHVGQNAAVWPDSSATAFDKANVRNGAYWMWTYNHLYAKEGDAPGTYEDPLVGVLVEYFAGRLQPDGVGPTITDVAIANNNVPTCAMRVARDGDLGPLYAYEPDEPCACLFEFEADGATACATCDDANPCAEGACRSGFCEEY